MCIRDRLGAAIQQAVGSELHQLACDLRFGGKVHRGVGVVPVSYTHLRAHETVLDLVCRLLLEKKNDRKITLSNHKLTIQQQLYVRPVSHD